MLKYYVWTEGCQMNVSDSQRLSGALEEFGCQIVRSPEEADVIVLNTCVVRESAENKAYGRLTSLRPIKQKRPEVVINLMGCLVGHRDAEALRKRFPYVDVFSPPSDPRPLMEFLVDQREIRASEAQILAVRNSLQDDLTASLAAFPNLLPASERGRRATAFVPIVLGCSHACSFCIIPYRRGGERSRPSSDILAEAASLAAEGVREVTLLGQIVDRYGLDSNDLPLPALLRKVAQVEGIRRIRFLTSHPNWMTEDLLRAVADIPEVCEHIEVPVQAGDDEILDKMRRGYTADGYRRLVARVRAILPEASIATDVIVGFPGETDAMFQRTYALLEELEMDVAHLARYSPREGTLSARKYPDDVPADAKMERFRALEGLQERIAARKNAPLLDTAQEVLVEGTHNGKWMGRTRTNRLVFFEDSGDWLGNLAQVRITRTGAWSLQGKLISLLQES